MVTAREMFNNFDRGVSSPRQTHRGHYNIATNAVKDT